jgi:hypothetical protein
VQRKDKVVFRPIFFFFSLYCIFLVTRDAVQYAELDDTLNLSNFFLMFCFNYIYNFINIFFNAVVLIVQNNSCHTFVSRHILCLSRQFLPKNVHPS